MTKRKAGYVLAAFLLIVGASSLHAKELTVWSGENGERVALAPRDAQGVNRHPATIPQKQLAEFLAGIHVYKKGKRKEGYPLFSEFKAATVASKLNEALAKASPRQDVIFRFNDSTRALGDLIGFVESTAGRGFVNRNGYLNIIFGTIKKGYQERWLLGRKTGEISTAVPGSRARPSESKYWVLPGAYTRFVKTRSGKRRSDWVIFDPEVSAPAVARREGEAGAQKSAMSLEARLRRLKRLNKSGLISDEIYNSEVRRLLQDT